MPVQFSRTRVIEAPLIDAHNIPLVTRDQLPPGCPLRKLRDRRFEDDVSGPTARQLKALRDEAFALEQTLSRATLDDCTAEEFAMKGARLRLIEQTIPIYAMKVRERDDQDYRYERRFEEAYGRYHSIWQRLRDGRVESREADQLYAEMQKMVTPE